MDGHVLYWVSQTLWWLGWASVCGVGFGILFTVSRFWRSASTESSPKREFLTGYQMMAKISLLAAVFFLGFLSNEHLHTSRMYPFSGLEVVQKYDKYDYKVKFVDDKLPWDMHICNTYDVDWDPGMLIVSGAYEDAGHCKDFGVHGAWFKVVRQTETGKWRASR